MKIQEEILELQHNNENRESMNSQEENWMNIKQTIKQWTIIHIMKENE